MGHLFADMHPSITRYIRILFADSLIFIFIINVLSVISHNTSYLATET